MDILNFCMDGNIEEIEKIKDFGDEFNTYYKNNSYTPISVSLLYGKFEVFNLLISKGVNVDIRNIYGRTALHDIGYIGNSEIINLLIKTGADVNAMDNLGFTPLYFAIEGGHLSAVKELVENGSDINIKDSLGNTLLNFAIEKGNNEIVNYLKSKM